MQALADAFWWIWPIVVIVGVMVQTRMIFRDRDERFPAEVGQAVVHEEYGGGRYGGIQGYGSPSVRLTLYPEMCVISARQFRRVIPLTSIASVVRTRGLVRQGLRIRFAAPADETFVFLSSDVDRLVEKFIGLGVPVTAA